MCTKPLAPKQKRSGANKARHKGKGSNFSEDCYPKKKTSEDQKHLHKAFWLQSKNGQAQTTNSYKNLLIQIDALVEHLTK
jgi:hypothetical protein